MDQKTLDQANALFSGTIDQPAVFIIGATGYIGGSVLVAVLQKHPEFVYTAIVRNTKDNKAIESLNVRVLQGSNKDLELVEKASSEHDIVFNFADADDLPLAEAVIKGLFKRASRKDGTRRPIYIHTSGTGVAMDGPSGEFKDIKIYDDTKVEDIGSIDAKQPHRNVDLQIFAAGQQGSIDTYIIAPSTIYGTGIGPVRNISQQVNGIIRTAVKHKQVLLVGPGTNVWNNVHIVDLAELYVLVLEQSLDNIKDSSENPKPTSPYERFYWGSAATHVWGEIAKDLAVLLHKKGLVDTNDVKSVTIEEHPELWATATNSRTVANRGIKSLGWKPSGKSLKDTLEEEIDLTLSQA
ncbi:hypothetical protein FRB94_010561 [Tulasnella sp. JGI-2019a]|nr:hypothetical protein FRB94_010561 [Tulasnella sp. JGI-2019a]KAG9039089.1 hypothetical protein FRB95_012800 [Tulasnella sp. JGI-2019a]